MHMAALIVDLLHQRWDDHFFFLNCVAVPTFRFLGMRMPIIVSMFSSFRVGVTGRDGGALVVRASLLLLQALFVVQVTLVLLLLLRRDELQVLVEQLVVGLHREREVLLVRGAVEQVQSLGQGVAQVCVVVIGVQVGVVVRGVGRYRGGLFVRGMMDNGR